MKKSIILLFVLMPAIIFAQSAAQLLQSGKDKIAGWEKNKYQNAYDDFDAAIKINPDFKEAYYYRGFCSYNIKLSQPLKVLGVNDVIKAEDIDINYQKAINDFTKVISYYPANATMADDLLFNALFYRSKIYTHKIDHLNYLKGLDDISLLYKLVSDRKVSPLSNRTITDEYYQYYNNYAAGKMGIWGSLNVKYWSGKAALEQKNTEDSKKIKITKENKEIEQQMDSLAILAVKYFKPQNYFDYSSRADAYSYLKKNKEAILDYTKSIELKPDVYTLQKRAKEYAEIKEYTLALNDYNKLLTDPANNYLTIDKVKLLVKMQRHKEALELLNNFIDKNPSAIYYFYERGKLYLSLNQKQNAIYDFEESVRLALGNVNYKSRKTEAELELEKLGITLLQIKPKLEAATIANEKYLKKDYENAIKDFDTYLSFPNSDPYYNILRGVCYYHQAVKLRKYPTNIEVPAISIFGAKAIADFNSYLKTKPAIHINSEPLVIQTNWWLALTYLDEYNYETALNHFKNVEKYFPNYEMDKMSMRKWVFTAQNYYADWLVNQGFLHLKNSNAIEAEKKYKKAIETYIKPLNKTNLIYRGEAYFELKKFKEAKDDYNEVLKLDPNNTTAKVGLTEIEEILKIPNVNNNTQNLNNKTNTATLSTDELNKLNAMLDLALASGENNNATEAQRINAYKETLKLLDIIESSDPATYMPLRAIIYLRLDQRNNAKETFFQSLQHINNTNKINIVKACITQISNFDAYTFERKRYETINMWLKIPNTPKVPKDAITWVFSYEDKNKIASAATQPINSVTAQLTFENPVYKGETLYYKGEIKNGKANGKGEVNSSINHYYKGDFVDNVYHGKGLHKWANGETYEGDWVNGERTGYGTYKWLNGVIFVGNWLQGKRSGKGKEIYIEGSVYDGDWKDDKYNGKGTLIWGNGQWKGDKYEGDWVNGNRTGYGKYTYANGKIEEGFFENGVLKNSNKQPLVNSNTQSNSINVQAEQDKAKLAVKEKRYNDAIANYTFLIEKVGGAYHYLERGKIYATQKNYEKAKLDFTSAITIWNTMQTEPMGFLKEDAIKELKKIEKK